MWETEEKNNPQLRQGVWNRKGQKNGFPGGGNREVRRERELEANII